MLDHIITMNGDIDIYTHIDLNMSPQISDSFPSVDGKSPAAETLALSQSHKLAARV